MQKLSYEGKSLERKAARLICETKNRDVKELIIGTYRDDEDCAIYALHASDSQKESFYYKDFRFIKKIVIEDPKEIDIIKKILMLSDIGCPKSKIIYTLGKIFSFEKVKCLISKIESENIFDEFGRIIRSDEIYINVDKHKTPSISFISFSLTKPLAILTDKQKNIQAQINTTPFYAPGLSRYKYVDFLGSTLNMSICEKIFKNFLPEKCIIEVDCITKDSISSNSIKQLKDIGAEDIQIIKNEKTRYAIKCKILKKILLLFMGFREISHSNDFSSLINANGEKPAWLIRKEIPNEKKDYFLQDVLFYRNNKYNYKKIINGVAIMNNGDRDSAEGICFGTQSAFIQRHISNAVIKWAKEAFIRRVVIRYFTYISNYGIKEKERKIIELKGINRTELTQKQYKFLGL